MFTFYEIAKVLSIEDDVKKWPDFEISGVEFDSRKIQPGNLFVPLLGTTDGHNYLGKAKENGAVVTLWSQENPPENIPYLKVKDTTKAFQQLAAFYRSKLNPQVIAVTGSNGKTTTKDMIAAVLTEKYSTYKTQGNFNNELGLPYTILHMPQETECLVLEMGMDHAGEITYLSNLAKPDIAAITLIGESHLENFADRSGIAKAKMEIVSGLNPEGFLVAPGDEVLLPPLFAHIKQPVHTFQLGTGNSELQGEVLSETKGSISFKMNFLPGVFKLPVSGIFNVKNAMIAAFIGEKLGVPTEKIQTALRDVLLTPNRSQWLTHHHLQILSDVYNANPTAMKAVLASFKKLTTTGKKVAVLGDMLELGETSGKLHESIAEELNPKEITEVFLYGEEMKALAKVLQQKYSKQQLHYYGIDEKNALIATLKEKLQPNDFVVIKGSHGMHLEEVVDALMAE